MKHKKRAPSIASFFALVAALGVVVPTNASAIDWKCKSGYAGVQKPGGALACHDFRNDNYWDVPTSYVDNVTMFYNHTNKKMRLIDWAPGFKHYLYYAAAGTIIYTPIDGNKVDAIGEC